MADLAKLELSAEEGQGFTQDLQIRLERLEVLKEVDTSGVEPLVMFFLLKMFCVRIR